MRLLEFFPGLLFEVKTGRELHDVLDTILDMAESGDRRYESELSRLRHDADELMAAGDNSSDLSHSQWAEDHGYHADEPKGFSVFDFDRDGSYTGPAKDSNVLASYYRAEAHNLLSLSILGPDEWDQAARHNDLNRQGVPDPKYGWRKNRTIDRLGKVVDMLAALKGGI